MNRRSNLDAVWIRVLCLAGVALATPGVAAPPVPRQVIVARPAETTGTVIVPDRFLRRWDPVTVFFAEDRAQAAGPEDHPENFVKVTPAHPGAYQWIDARTLQFRAAEPWPSLARFTWTAGETTVSLPTLLEAPSETIPGADSTGLDPVESITLKFNEPLDDEVLSKTVSIELRPLPGISSESARWLTSEDFQIKTLERSSRSDSASYVLALAHPIPLGTHATVHMRLSLEDQTPDSGSSFTFSTAEPFRVVSMGCTSDRFPVSPNGARYGREQALNCGSDARNVVVEMSAPLQDIGPIEGRNLARFTPAVDGLTYTVSDRQLIIGGEFAWGTEYQFSIVPTRILDRQNRVLEMGGTSEVYVYFPRKENALRWLAGQGVLERFGPQMVPLYGRGDERVDLRIHAIRPLDRSFWPMADAVLVDDTQRPPNPGEEPAPIDLAANREDYNWDDEVRGQIWALSAASPAVSRVVDLPLRREGGSATFGLDLKPVLAEAAGAGQPGTYMVGLRRLNGTTSRAWMRVQVTDLTLTTLEESKAVVFAVTSLSTAKPVPGATVRVEASESTWSNRNWIKVTEGITDNQGRFRWGLPDTEESTDLGVRRIVVEKEGDTLVLDATSPPDHYADNHWSSNESTWLQWTRHGVSGRGPEASDLCHMFTERPVYRPEESVHIKGYLREREAGRLTPLELELPTLVVEGPGDVSWKYPLEVNELGSFYHEFTEDSLPTGSYRAHIEDRYENTYGQVSWQMEAYRIPEFELRVNAPDWAPLDREFEVSMTATYYAGGRVAARPVQWRVTQFPYTWMPGALEGFLYSSDERYSQHRRFQSTPALERQETTDDQGFAKLKLDPSIEPTSQPRSYVVEATVTGADDQTVTTTKRVLALPPFALGMKLPRFLPQATQIQPLVIAVGPDGKPVSDVEITVRLSQRQWHSHLQASDFSDGVARYITDVVDEKVRELKVKSGAEPLPVPLSIERAGVYIVEIEGRDRLGRSQTLSIDLYAGGPEPVTWAKPAAGVFSVASDEKDYDPGQIASLVLRSPFQRAEALVVIEAPDANRYEWLQVENGAATYQVPIDKTFVPRVPVHFILMRGRLPMTGPMPGNSTDAGKPATMAATEWLTVNPVENQLQIGTKYPERARPGEQVDIEITLSDLKKNPLSGEVTLWLVDAAVLALGKEQRLDPLPDFITAVRSYLRVGDTRGMPFGFLPYAENPGGDEGEESGLLDQSTVRKNFKPVAYYNPAIEVGPDGRTVIHVQMPDNLTTFKLRAKAISGPDRFGYTTGQIAVRLPVIVQPALPRFVRPGDQFTATAIGRVVEGEGGAGIAEIEADGITLSGPSRRELTLTPNQPQRIEVAAQVPDPILDEEGNLTTTEVRFLAAVERTSDRARDAFEVTIPIRDDRQRVTKRWLVDLPPGKSVAWDGVPEPARPGTIRRSLLVTDQPALLRMAAGLSFLLEYPYGCTEQRMSRARAALAMRKFQEVLQLGGDEEDLKRRVAEVLDYVPLVIDSRGLCGYWPGSRGSVSLTAWVVQFLVEARAAGFTVDSKMQDGLIRALQAALRSDYDGFVDGEAYAERTWALSALARAGHFDAAYAAELARKAQFLDLEGLAEVLLAFALSGEPTTPVVAGLVSDLQKGIIVRLFQGREIYGGLQERRDFRSSLILPSETRTVAEMARALALMAPQSPRLQLLVDALVTLGAGDGWGSTNANSSALFALSEILQTAPATAQAQKVDLKLDGTVTSLEVGAAAAAVNWSGTSAARADLVLQKGANPRPIAARVETSYVPQAKGSEVAAAAQGFVVSRELYLVKPGDAPPEKIALDAPGKIIRLAIGDVVEEHVQVVNPESRTYVAVVVPLAAGIEPLNPRLETAPPEAKPRGTLTMEASYVQYLDDQAAFYYDELPKGTYDFYFRTRATTEGLFIQPAAKTEMMYDAAVRGQSAGAAVEVKRAKGN